VPNTPPLPVASWVLLRITQNLKLITENSQTGATLLVSNGAVFAPSLFLSFEGTAF
jgi:hypothetical protein